MRANPFPEILLATFFSQTAAVAALRCLEKELTAAFATRNNTVRDDICDLCVKDRPVTGDKPRTRVVTLDQEVAE